MNDPYAVLGVAPSATDDEVKKAYRDLARKYHPDTYQNNPLADLAEEKMKEINDAYEMVNKMRSSGGGANAQGNGYHGQGYGYQQGGYYQPHPNPIYQQIRLLIQSGNLVDAEKLLEANANMDAEWCFLSGMVAYRNGWLDVAQQHFAQANNLDPMNPEYKQALHANQSTMAHEVFQPRCCCCPCTGDCCTSLLCINCLCGDGCCCCG